ncbi:MAG: hypothetical protein WA651_16850 [Candidatus Sulfotelmatobacter sp.]
MITTRDQRKRAAEKAVFDQALHARIERERNTPSDEQRRKALYQSCIDEEKAETAAQRERELRPIKEYQKTLDADRERAARNARYNLSLPNCTYLAEICCPFSEYTGAEGDYLDAVRNTFTDFKERLASQGVEITDAGVQLLASLSDDNLSLNWSSPATFPAVWEHLCEVGFAKEGRDFTITEQKQQEPPQEESRREPQTYDELRNAADAEYLAMAKPVWNDFQTYLMENWGVALTESQQHEALETAKRLNLNPCIPDSWITVKNNLVRRQVLPECRTVDERLSAFIETVPDVSSPTGRRAIAEERNRLMSEEYKKR